MGEVEDRAGLRTSPQGEDGAGTACSRHEKVVYVEAESDQSRPERGNMRVGIGGWTGPRMGLGHWGREGEQQRAGGEYKMENDKNAIPSLMVR